MRAQLVLLPVRLESFTRGCCALHSRTVDEPVRVEVVLRSRRFAQIPNYLLQSRERHMAGKRISFSLSAAFCATALVSSAYFYWLTRPASDEQQLVESICRIGTKSGAVIRVVAYQVDGTWDVVIASEEKNRCVHYTYSPDHGMKLLGESSHYCSDLGQ